MTLDPTARESNIRDSVKKYFKDTLRTANGIDVTFDRQLTFPDVGVPSTTTNRWVLINFGPMEIKHLSEIYLDVVCCTRQDNEGYKLAHLRDLVLGFLSDETKTDSFARIPFYRSYENQTWELLGAFVVTDVQESGQLQALDGTKYKILSVKLRTASKI